MPRLFAQQAAACSMAFCLCTAACTKFETAPPDAGDDSHAVTDDGGPGVADADAASVSDVREPDSPTDTSSSDASAERPDMPSGSILWARSGSSASLYGVAEGSTGVVIAGSIDAPANLGGALLAPVGTSDTVIAQYGADGTHLFSSRMGGSVPAGTGAVTGFLDTLDTSGAPLVHGVSYCNPSGAAACNKIDVGLGAVDPGGGPGADGFVGRYSITSGKAAWVTRLVGPGEDHVKAVTKGPDGTIFIAGWFDQSTTLRAAMSSRMFLGGGDRDIFIAQLNAFTGEIGMTKTFAGPAFEEPYTIAWTGSHIIAAGNLGGTATFGTKTLTSADFDIWVAKLMPTDGTPVWAVSFGALGRDVYPYLTVDPNGDIYLTGTITGRVTFGPYSVGGAGGADIFVAKLRNSDGNVIWATSLGSSGDDAAADIAINSSGHLIVSGTIAGPLQVGGQWAGATDAVLASFDGDGTRLWTKVIGTSGMDYGSAVDSGVDAFYATVTLEGDIGASIEGVPIVGAPKPVGVLLKLKP